jgi:hypothetical protein
MRGGGISSVYPFVPGLAVLGVLLALVAWVAIRELRRRMPIRLWLTAAIFLLLATGFIVLMSVLTQFRLLGRHLMPLEPVVILGAAVAVTALVRSGRNWAKTLACGFCMVWLASALSLRFAPRHARDDYRSAAALAVSALQSGKSVWWAADGCAGEYYRVPLTDQPTVQGEAWLAVNLGQEQLTGMALPDVVVLSKADVYDASGTLAKMLSEQGYRNTQKLRAFTIWEKQAPIGESAAMRNRNARELNGVVQPHLVPNADGVQTNAFGIYRTPGVV